MVNGQLYVADQLWIKDLLYLLLIASKQSKCSTDWQRSLFIVVFIFSAAQPWNFRIQYNRIDKFSPDNLMEIDAIKNHESYVGGNGQRPYDIAVMKVKVYTVSGVFFLSQ